MDTSSAFQVIELTPWRRIWLNILSLPRTNLPMFGLLEVDVTDVRQGIAAHKAGTGEVLSFSGYLVHCLAQAVDEHKEVQAYRKGHKQFIVWNDVDVGIMVELVRGEKRELTGHVIRGANRMTYREIHQEIRTVQSSPAPKERVMPKWFRTGMLMPWPFSNWFVAFLSMIARRDPAFTIAMQGTVGVTSVGMFGDGHSFFGLETTRHSLDLIVGSTCWKPVVVEGSIVPREVLNLTVMFDHNVIDGAPAARFVRRLVELIESGSGLEIENR